MLTTFVDNRTDVIGAEFDIDTSKFEGLCALAALSPLVQVSITLTDATEDAPPHGALCKDDGDVHDGVWGIELPVSDRLEFSDKAVERVNRNLLHTLRHLSQVCMVTEFFPDEVSGAVMGFGGPAMEQDAYLTERKIKEVPDARCLLPKVVTLAQDPVVEEGGK